MFIPTLRSLELTAVKSAGVQRARAYAPSGPVCVATQGFELQAGVAAAHGFDLKGPVYTATQCIEFEIKNPIFTSQSTHAPRKEVKYSLLIISLMILLIFLKIL